MENFIDLNSNNKDIYIGNLNFKYAEIIFGTATMLAVFPQIYKIHKTKMAKDFSMIFIGGMIIVNILFFLVGFINNIYGLMLGSIFFIVYNLTVIYYYNFGIQYTLTSIK